MGVIRFYNATAQLDAGVRLLTAQIRNNNGLWHLCHSSCGLLDAGRLGDWLASIRLWLENNANEVITILLVNSEYAPAAQIDAEFKGANLTSYAYVPPSRTTALEKWPTLQDMISNSTRLVAFIAPLDPASNTVAPYLLDEFTFVWENPYDVMSPVNFSCLPERPLAVQGNLSAALNSGRLTLMNHFLYTPGPFGIELPDTEHISNTNAPSGTLGNLGARAANCTSQYRKAPTFILVDFFDQGPAIATVNKLNGITPVGKGQSSSPNTPTSAASFGRTNLLKGFADLTRIVRDGAKRSIGHWVWSRSRSQRAPGKSSWWH